MWAPEETVRVRAASASPERASDAEAGVCSMRMDSPCVTGPESFGAFGAAGSDCLVSTRARGFVRLRGVTGIRILVFISAGRPARLKKLVAYRTLVSNEANHSSIRSTAGPPAVGWVPPSITTNSTLPPSFALNRSIAV